MSNRSVVIVVASYVNCEICEISPTRRATGRPGGRVCRGLCYDGSSRCHGPDSGRPDGNHYRHPLRPLKNTSEPWSRPSIDRPEGSESANFGDLSLSVRRFEGGCRIASDFFNSQPSSRDVSAPATAAD